MGLLRTLYAITVVLAHSDWNNGWAFVGGRNAVRLFYIISGFLISYVLRNNPTYKSPGRFYISRALRLYPIYYVVAIITACAIFAAKTNFLRLYGQIPLDARILLVLSNILIVGQDWVMFSTIKGGKLVMFNRNLHSESDLFQGLLVPQAWTLGLELTFYLIAPFLLKSLRATILVLACSVILRIIFVSSGFATQDPWTYRFLPFEMALFLSGALSERLILPQWNRILKRTRYVRGISLAGTLTLVALSVGYFMIPLPEICRKMILFPIFIGFLPLAFICQNNYKWDKMIGELSYPIYIGHILIVWMVTFISKHIGSMPLLGIAIINVVLSIGFAYCLNRWVGRPVEDLRDRIKNGRSRVKISDPKLLAKRSGSST